MSAAYILVVDDEPDIRGLVQEILEDEGQRIQAVLRKLAGAHASGGRLQ